MIKNYHAGSQQVMSKEWTPSSISHADGSSETTKCQ